MIPVLADLLPNVNELFEWKGILRATRVVRVQQDGAAWRSSRRSSASGLFCVGVPQEGAGAGRRPERRRDGLRDRRGAIAARGRWAEDGKKWTPFLATLFFWIFFINIWSTFPFIQFPATSRIAIPLFLALQTWVIFIVVGFKHQGLGYFRNVCPPGVPGPLLFLVVPIEFISKYLHAAVLAGGPTLRQHDRRPRAARDLRDHDQRAADHAQQRHLPDPARHRCRSSASSR